MRRLNFLFLFAILVMLLGDGSIAAHAGHEEAIDEGQKGEYLDQIILWLGSFHPVILHFPIALIIASCCAEWLFFSKRHLLYAHAAKFMVDFAALMAPLTALLGLALSLHENYGDDLAAYFWWHRFWGLLTAMAIVFASIARHCHASGKVQSLKPYYVFLSVSVWSVILAGFFGGSLTFGTSHLLPKF